MIVAAQIFHCDAPCHHCALHQISPTTVCQNPDRHGRTFGFVFEGLMSSAKGVRIEAQKGSRGSGAERVSLGGRP